jgi:hypothetical protein
MGMPIFSAAASGLVACGTLADDSKIDDFSHAMFDVFGICDGPQVWPTAFRAKYADTVTRLAADALPVLVHHTMKCGGMAVNARHGWLIGRA